MEGKGSTSMSNEENTNWSQSVGGIVLKDGCVLLVRHTYGAGKGKLIIPGGYVKIGETPQEALIREVGEETSIVAVPTKLVGMRFNLKDWYAVFLMDYVEGEPRSDEDENDQALFLPVEEALESPDVPDLTRVLLKGALAHSDKAFETVPFVSREKNGKYSLYSLGE